MFWVFYMIFSVYRSHRNRFYWQNGKLHFIKQNRRQAQLHQRRLLTPITERQRYNENIRQWFIFYSVFLTIIVAVLIHRFYSHLKLST